MKSIRLFLTNLTLKKITFQSEQGHRNFDPVLAKLQAKLSVLLNFLLLLKITIMYNRNSLFT